MPKIPTQQNGGVPLEAPDPIQHLLDAGVSVPQLAVAWDLKSSDSVYRLKRGEYIPTPKTAKLMARSFGWSAGEVIDKWIELTEAR